jgi:hypothetical protein
MGGGLAVHLQKSGTWFADHAAKQMNVIDLRNTYLAAFWTGAQRLP